MDKKYYVSCTDKFFSGWGQAEGQISKFVVVCDNLSDANKVLSGMRQDPYLKSARLGHSKPRFRPEARYHVEFKTYEECTRFH